MAKFSKPLHYHQCTNIECSATFRTIESVDGVIRAAPEKPDPAPVTPPPPRKVQGCYSSPFRH
ncbi:TPA: transcriptional regulator [Kluyvera ascorbata]|nr:MULTISPECIES: ogr/Delta-like zinc finger family protein [unclassified Klebsiella]HAT3953372.1 transcriptional regulator [Kluyvera ascorbata]